MENIEGIGWDEILFDDESDKKAEEQIAQIAAEAGDDGVVIVFPPYVDDSCPECGCEGPWKEDHYVHERGCAIRVSLENGSKW